MLYQIRFYCSALLSMSAKGLSVLNPETMSCEFSRKRIQPFLKFSPAQTSLCIIKYQPYSFATDYRHSRAQTSHWFEEFFIASQWFNNGRLSRYYIAQVLIFLPLRNSHINASFRVGALDGTQKTPSGLYLPSHLSFFERI